MRPDAKRFLGDRSSSEMKWVDIFEPLKARGYFLRARYEPDWIPSWTGLAHIDKSGVFFPEDYEDGLTYHNWNIMDATREDGLPVILKLVYLTDMNSVPFATYFSEDTRRSDPRNHCVPLLDVLWFHELPHYHILVHPRYLDWNIWPFLRVGEIVDFLSQVFEGLSFMHEHLAAHLDASFKNIMMDGLHLLKEPCHPVKPLLKACAHGDAEHWERFESPEPIKYYFIDFDQSVLFQNRDAVQLVERNAGQDNTAPELHSPPYDAFRLDVYCVGRMIFAYENVEFVRPLVVEMMNLDPAKRPTAQEVSARFEAIQRSLFRTELERPAGHIEDYDSNYYDIFQLEDRVPLPRRRATLHGTGWIPSWLSQLSELEASGGLFYWKDFEDGLGRQKYNVMDAVSEDDGVPVVLKLIFQNDQNSIPFCVFFSSEPRRSDPRNHCAPLLRVLKLREIHDSRTLVLPRYLDWRIWPFVQVGEIVDFLEQMFEGLAFMHEHHAAHLDISLANIMMDGLHLLKEPCHPADPRLRADAKGDAQHWERFESQQPVKYYFIDFDQSVRFDSAAAVRPVERNAGQILCAPELTSPPYDAFRLDIFCLGYVILSQLLNASPPSSAYENVEFVRPLAEAMMHSDPAKRPTAAEVVSRFADIRRVLFPADLVQDPGHIDEYRWPDFHMGLIPARVPPLRRRATFSGMDSPEAQLEVRPTSTEPWHFRSSDVVVAPLALA
ncbi:hypothetical protein AURDEDRAFT_163289 [Auricularia subglabra TFB-10046 SS5]|nr:hypothetical protein AURDEDRAFT_163289 [Auricularia subglabra TFB-10046 SS5]